MNAFSENQLDELIQIESAPSISLYMPTHKSDGEVQQDHIRFKNLLRVAEELIAGEDLGSSTSTDLIEKARAEIDNALLWDNRTHGLAVFVSPHFLRYYHLPVSVPELAVAGHHFHITPLLPMIERGEYFYILALSRKQVRLWRATPDEIHQVHVKGLPRNIDEALWYEIPEKQSGFRSLPTTVGGGRQAVFYGQGAGPEEHKDELFRYFRAIDSALHAQLKDEHIPLILASVGYLAPIYRGANTYPYLVEDIVEGNPIELKADALCAQASRLVEPHLHRARREALAHYTELFGTRLTSDEPADILAAAFDGRVQVLLLNTKVQRWGNYEPRTKTLAPELLPDRDGEELLNRAAIETLRRHGQCFALPPEEMPNHVACAALFRY